MENRDHTMKVSEKPFSDTAKKKLFCPFKLPDLQFLKQTEFSSKSMHLSSLWFVFFF